MSVIQIKRGLQASVENLVLAQGELAVALDTVEITLIDHLVFSDDDYVSMAQSGYFKPGESMCVL